MVILGLLVIFCEWVISGVWVILVHGSFWAYRMFWGIGHQGCKGHFLRKCHFGQIGNFGHIDHLRHIGHFGCISHFGPIGHFRCISYFGLSFWVYLSL